jgi:hypothetical protein
MGVHYESTVFGELRPSNIHGREVVGACGLNFVVIWTLQATRDEVLGVCGTAAWISVQVHGTNDIMPLGQAVPETAWCNETRNVALDHQQQYRLPLSHAQLLAVENLRQGQELVFHIDMRGNSTGSRGMRTFADTMMMRITASDWSRILREANLADVLLVGVRMPSGTLDDRLKPAIELVRKANEHLILGLYSPAVAECRRAIESLWKAAALTDRAREARKQLASMQTQQGMTKLERELAVGEALRIFCHSGHHVGPDGIPEDFGRHDAAMVVAGTAALLSSLVAAPSRLEQKSPEEPAPPAKPPAAPATPAAAEESRPLLADRVAKALAHLRSQATNKPSTLKALKSDLDSFFGKKLKPGEIDQVVEQLKAGGLFTVSGSKLTFHLPAAKKKK